MAIGLLRLVLYVQSGRTIDMKVVRLLGSLEKCVFTPLRKVTSVHRFWKLLP